MPVKRSRCLVTGGAGLIGSTIADQLLAAGAHVTILDNLSGGKYENMPGEAYFVHGDIRDEYLTGRLIQQSDFVFHEAAIKILRCTEEPGEALDVLAKGTFNVFRAAAEHGARVIAASSASVYGLAEEFPVDEKHHPYGNETFYGAAKLFTEGMARSFAVTHDLDYVMLRYFNVYGPKMDTRGAYTEVLPRWMDQITLGKPPRIDGDGTNTRDFVYAGDVAKANLAAAEADVRGVFNIGSGVETSLNTLAQMLLKVMGSDLEPEYGPERKADPCPRRLADISRAKQQLGWEPDTDLESGLKELVTWAYPVD